MKKRYPSCNNESGCATCALSSYGLDCRNIPIDKPPLLRNAEGYPFIFSSQEAIAIISMDFSDHEIECLQASLKLHAAREKAKLSRKAAAEKCGIPLRTFENWEFGVSLPKPLLLNAVIDTILNK